VSGKTSLAREIWDPVFGDMLFIPSCPINILSLGVLHNTGWVVRYSQRFDAFFIRKKNNNSRLNDHMLRACMKQKTWSSWSLSYSPPSIHTETTLRNNAEGLRTQGDYIVFLDTLVMQHY
jgi:hypothetical protein